MRTRVAVAAVGIPVVVILTLIGGYPLYLFLVAAGSVALIEFYMLAERKGGAPLRVLGVIAGFCITSAFFYQQLHLDLGTLLQQKFPSLRLPTQWQILLMVLLVFTLLTLFMELFRGKPFPSFNIGSTISGVLYVSLSFWTMVGIRELFGEKILPGRLLVHFAEGSLDAARETVYRWGGYTLISIFACVWICDTVAQFIGVRWGRHKLLERVSPNKTWEGAIGGLVAAILSSLLARSLVLPFLTLTDSFVVGLVVGVFGQLGDLAESLFKRDAEVKDSSRIIPGHGGVLDRFDSLLFVSPILFLYFDLVIF